MEETSNVPKLRFNGYHKEWKEFFLEDISLKIGDGLHSTPNYVESSEYYFINGNNIFNGYIHINADVKCVSKDEYDKYRKDLNLNTILLSINGTIGNLAFFNNEKVMLGKSVAFIKLNKNQNKQFIYYYLHTNKILHYFNSELTGTTIKNLSLKTLKNTKISIPQITEQEKVTYFLKNIDNKINLLYKRFDRLKDFKDFCLQNLFSENKLRFNFKSDWSTSLIKDVFNERNEKGFTDLDLLSVSINEGVYVNENELSSNEKIRYKHVCSGDIVYNSMRMWQGASGVSPQEGLVSPAYTVLIPKNSVNPDYFAYYFKTSKMINEFRKYSQGLTSDTWNLKYPLISKITIKYPSLQEQIQIASFLSTIDDKINYVKNQITEMEKFKKGLLQEMFV